MRVLALDLSTHGGYAIFDGVKGQKPSLVQSGTIHLGKTVHEYGPYPFCYKRAAEAMASLIFAGTCMEAADVVVIEEINLGRNRYTQKLLENIHTAVLNLTHAQQVVVYIDSSEWRHNLGLRMSKEQKRANARLSKAKRVAAEVGASLDKKALGIRGKITPKHLSVAKANEAYGLKLKVKDNDQADAICIGLAYFNGATPCDGV